MQRVDVESRAIKSVGYDDDAQTLEIEFRSGRVYAYVNVDRSLYEWLLKVPDKGGLFNRLIRDRFDEKEITPIPEAPDLLTLLRDSVKTDGSTPSEE